KALFIPSTRTPPLRFVACPGPLSMTPTVAILSRSVCQPQPEECRRGKRPVLAGVPLWIAVALCCVAWWCDLGTSTVAAQEGREATQDAAADEAPAFDPRGPRMIVAGEPSTDDSAAPTFDPRQPAPAMADSAQPDAAFPAPPPQQPDFKPID